MTHGDVTGLVRGQWQETVRIDLFQPDDSRRSTGFHRGQHRDGLQSAPGAERFAAGGFRRHHGQTSDIFLKDATQRDRFATIDDAIAIGRRADGVDGVSVQLCSSQRQMDRSRGTSAMLR